MHPVISDAEIAAFFIPKSRTFFKLRARDRDWWHGFVPVTAEYTKDDDTPITPAWTNAGAYTFFVPSHRYGVSGLRIRMVGALEVSWTRPPPPTGPTPTALPGTKVAQVRLAYTDGVDTWYSTIGTSSTQAQSTAQTETVSLMLDIPEYYAEKIDLAVEMLVSAAVGTTGGVFGVTWTITGTFNVGQSESGLRSYLSSLPAPMPSSLV